MTTFEVLRCSWICQKILKNVFLSGLPQHSHYHRSDELHQSPGTKKQVLVLASTCFSSLTSKIQYLSVNPVLIDLILY